MSFTAASAAAIACPMFTLPIVIVSALMVRRDPSQTMPVPFVWFQYAKTPAAKLIHPFVPTRFCVVIWSVVIEFATILSAAIV